MNKVVCGLFAGGVPSPGSPKHQEGIHEAVEGSASSLTERFFAVQAHWLPLPSGTASLNPS